MTLSQETLLCICGFFTLLVCLALFLAGYSVMQMRRTVEASHETIRVQNRDMAQVKGLSLHQADPEHVAQNGVPWEKVEAEQSAVVDMNRKRTRERRRWHLTEAIKSPNLQGGEARRAELRMQLEALDKESA